MPASPVPTGVDRVEREEVLTSVREHIDENLASLGHPPAPSEVTVILAGLGSVEEILATLEDETGGWQARNISTRPTAWLPGAAVVSGVISLLFAINVVVAVPLAVTAVVIGILGVRRRDAHMPPYVLAVALGSLSLLATAVLVFGLFAGPPVPATPEPVVSVTSMGA